MSRERRTVICIALLLLALPARAADTWTTIRPGIDYLYRTIGGTRPQKVHATRIDLTRPNIGLHASADRQNVEWKVNTLTFAQNTQSLVAVNGDWSCVPQSACGVDYLRPLSLAISDGNLWNPHRPRADIGASWGYFACTIDKKCDLNIAPVLDDPRMVFNPLHVPNVYPLRYFNAVGANAVPAILNGVRETGCYDTQSAPRTAACLERNGTTLWLFVVDGRNPGAGETGMTCDEVRDQLLGFGCWNAMFLDGGGSSTMVIDGQVKNTPSDGSLRTVGNHFGIIYSDTIDPRCRKANGRWCEGTVIKACQGGRFLGEGDCGYFGAGCQEDGAFGFCVHPYCPDGDGLRKNVCLDRTKVAGCSDGAYSEGDCGAFGLVCGGARGSAQCMDPRCVVPKGAACSGDLLVTCDDGRFGSTLDCAAGGKRCDAASAACVTVAPPDAGTPDAGASDEGTPDAGTPDAGTPDAGTPDAGASDAGAVAPDDAGASGSDDDAGSRDAGLVGPPDSGADAGRPSFETLNPGGCACGTGGAAPIALVLLALGARRRRR